MLSWSAIFWNLYSLLVTNLICTFSMRSSPLVRFTLWRFYLFFNSCLYYTNNTYETLILFVLKKYLWGLILKRISICLFLNTSLTFAIEIPYSPFSRVIFYSMGLFCDRMCKVRILFFLLGYKFLSFGASAFQPLDKKS